MKILYIFLENEKNIGVRKKIKYQIKALSKLGNEVDKIYVNSTIAYLNDNILFKVGDKLLKRFVLFFKLKKVNLELYDLIYIRNPGSNPFFISFLKKIKNKKIIMEVPTYPYDNEANTFLLKVQNMLDKVYRRKLKNYVQRIVTYSDDKEIWGIPCVNISNGIDLEEIKIINKKNIKDKIIFTSVSNCSIWHGIDRFIYSILEYIKNNGKEEIVFNIIGEGNETSKLKRIVKENKILENIVIFYGRQTGKELDEFYNITDIGVGSLGRFRSGIVTMKALKNREYAAKGLPMIYSEVDLGFEDKKFVYKISHDESLIEIEKIIDWYKNLKVTSKEIRDFSKKFSWDIQMRKVIEEIENTK